MLQIRKMECRK